MWSTATKAVAVSQFWVDEFTLKSEYAKNAFMNAPERFAGNETLQRFKPKGEWRASNLILSGHSQ